MEKYKIILIKVIQILGYLLLGVIGLFSLLIGIIGLFVDDISVIIPLLIFGISLSFLIVKYKQNKFTFSNDTDMVKSLEQGKTELDIKLKQDQYKLEEKLRRREVKQNKKLKRYEAKLNNQNG